ncbi:T9SS type A sorting domain-containing protein [Flavobacterium sp. 3HN19-14]|uniref:T9SS type A sorting domain-containing protein n=1 Tax=Flavobacterium sp. 3HN19-14 TaxID=3448133 RepID=UPI003EE1515F
MIVAYDASLLSVPSSDDTDFGSFPNPVKDILNLTYSKEITKVTVYNLLGQEVTAKPVGANWSQIDMSDLSKGTYLVKITAGSQIRTIKVVKE